MFWLRAILFSTPLLLVFGGVWLFDRVAEFQLSQESGVMVCAIQEPVGYLNPLAPASGITGEITDLIFDPLLTRDDDLRLRPHLLDQWTTRTVVTIRCSSEEAAGETEAMLRSGEWLSAGMNLLALDRTESVLTVALEGVEAGREEKWIAGFSPEVLGHYLLVKLTLKHSIRDSFETYLQGSVEKSQIRMLEYRGDDEVDLFVQGDTDLFLRELQLYYQSNRNLDPQIENLGQRCYTSAHEMILDFRNDVFWHDGERFTTEDVVFSFQELTRPDSPLPLVDSFRFVGTLRAESAQRIKIELADEVPATMLECWEKLPVLPSHCFTHLSDPSEREAFFANPIGTGPYRLSSRRNDGGVELTANENYFAGVPLEKRLRYRQFGSLEATLLALRSGTLDLIVPDERFSDWSARNPGVVRTMHAEPRFQHFVAWNLDKAPWDQAPVRLALAQAINLEPILRDTKTEFQQGVKSLFFPGIESCDATMALPLYDPRGAEALFEAQGFHLNKTTGMREGAKGIPLAFTVSVSESNEEHLRLATALAEQWAGVGVGVKVEALSWNDLLSTRLLNREFDGVLLSWEIPYERDRFAVWHSSQAGPGGTNFTGLNDPGVDETLEKIRFESDPSLLKNLTARLQESIARLQPCLFLCDTGRILTLRTGSLEVFRPQSGDRTPKPLSLGKAGLPHSRPWWVRQETVEKHRLDFPEPR
ncbi:MAG: hypothetical protein KBF76_09420 [Verrucomicrobiales bacterium]|nr:hypothetical protein [Verrucomicrobiales bacterium]